MRAENIQDLLKVNKFLYTQEPSRKTPKPSISEGFAN